VSQKGGDVEGLPLSPWSQERHSDKDSPDRLRSSSLIPVVLAEESSVAEAPAISETLSYFGRPYPRLHAQTTTGLSLLS
jgi:hypothetical protein